MGAKSAVKSPTLSLTNNPTDNALVTTNADSKDYNKIDLTLSSAGTSYNGQNEVGLDVSVSIDPFKDLPQLWVGVSQSLYWTPALAASTDIDAIWNIAVTDKIYLNPAWSVGDVYGASDIQNVIRTGPELYIQYYTSDNAYIYAGVNYDLLTKTSDQGWQTSSSNNGWRWSIGIGLEF